MLLNYEKIAERLKVVEHMPGLAAWLNVRMVALHRNAFAAVTQSKTLLGKLVFETGLFAGLNLLLACLTGEFITFLCAGVFLPLLYAALRLKELDKRIRRQQRSILHDLPEFINHLTLLVNAGEPIQKALIHCCGEREANERQPLYTELNQMSNELQNNISFVYAMENFGKRCGVPEAVLFTSTVLLHYKRGGDDLVAALSKLVGELWERRKSLARTLAEEASSKLVFPMVFIFFILMVIIAAPAILAMNF
jgi:tight adherence protein C